MIQDVKLFDFAEALLKRIEENQTIDCCKDEIRMLARIVKEKLPDETIRVEWH